MRAVAGRGWRVVAAIAVAAALLRAPSTTIAQTAFAVRGMVIAVDAARRTMTVSHERIPGFMDAMTMPFEVDRAEDLRGVGPGAIVEFTLVVGERRAHATRISVKRYESVERDPRSAGRLALMKKLAGLATPPVAIGARVPDFTLIDQTRQPVTLSRLAGKVVAVNFIYTRCALPQFCLRMANTFGVLHRRLSRNVGRDLILLTITFDPERDTPEVLRDYAARWNADLAGWRFLSGPAADVRRVAGLFGQEAFADEGLLNHSLRTAVIDRGGSLVANIEGNQFTPEQLHDLVLATLRR